MSKSMLNTRNATATTVVENGTLTLGSAVHGIGCGIKLNGNSITITEPGTYKILSNLTYAVTGTTAVTLAMLANGTEVATATETPAAAGALVNVTTVGTVYISCKCLAPVNVTFVASEAGTENELDVLVERM